MSGFWPDDIPATQALSPREIMERAGIELSRRTTILTVSIQENRLTDRIVLGFTVKNEIYLFEFNLFEASHRLDQSYPVVIDPPESDIPEFLKRERYVPGSPPFLPIFIKPELTDILKGTPGRVIKNEWVCATPAEFTEKLKKLFALDHVKSRIISLQALKTTQKPSERGAESTEEEPLEGEAENDLEPQPGESPE